MAALSIQQYGYGLELYLARITRDQWLRFERACAGWFGIYRKTTLHKKWYAADKDFQRIFGVRDWRQLYAGAHRYYGPLLRERSQGDEFCDRTTVLLDGEEIRLDPRQVRQRFFKALSAPKLGDNHIVVCHGEGYNGYTHYTTHIEGRFDPAALRFDFIPCGNNGWVMQAVRYGDAVLLASDDPNQREILQIQVMTAEA
jgi:hypothetical protein